MATEDEMLLVMKNCTIHHDFTRCYVGLDDFKRYARQHPQSALRIAWEVLMSREDPGRDDGALCIELIEVVNKAVGSATWETHVLDAWPRLNDSIRRNVLAASGNSKAMSSDLLRKLFEHPATRTEQRHRIVAGLASGDQRPEFEDDIVTLANRIGDYQDCSRQVILNEFIASVVLRYS